MVSGSCARTNKNAAQFRGSADLPQAAASSDGLTAITRFCFVDNPVRSPADISAGILIRGGGA